MCYLHSSFKGTMFCYCVSDMQDSPKEADKYGTVKRVVPQPQATQIHSPANQDKTASTPSPSSSHLIGTKPHTDANPSLVNESALLVGSTVSDLSLLTKICLISDSSFLNNSTSLGSLCMTPSNGKMQYMDLHKKSMRQKLWNALDIPHFVYIPIRTDNICFGRGL